MAEAIRGDIPEVAAQWLAPIADDFETLTEDREGESDEEFIARIRLFTENIGDLYEKMDRQSLEDALYAANSEGLLLGIRSRLTQIRQLRTRRQRKFRAGMNA